MNQKRELRQVNIRKGGFQVFHSMQREFAVHIDSGLPVGQRMNKGLIETAWIALAEILGDKPGLRAIAISPRPAHIGILPGQRIQVSDVSQVLPMRQRMNFESFIAALDEPRQVLVGQGIADGRQPLLIADRRKLGEQACGHGISF